MIITPIKPKPRRSSNELLRGFTFYVFESIRLKVAPGRPFRSRVLATSSSHPLFAKLYVDQQKGPNKYDTRNTNEPPL